MKTAAVIGAGPAGLVALKELKQAGLDVQGFERNSQVGGIWAADEPSGVWEELTMNINRRFLEFSDFPWEENRYEGYDKAHHGFYPHNSETKAYLQDYAKHFGLLDKIQLSTDVKSIDSVESGGWNIATAPRGGGKTFTQKFDFVVVCSGANSKACSPLEDSTFKAFTGEKLHSQQFTTVKGYEGKRVLAVGSAVTGGDIPAVLARHGNCQTVINSVRNMGYRTHVVSQKDHRLYDDILLTRFPTLLMKALPDAITSKGLKAEILSNWPDQPTAENAGVIAPDEDIRKCMFFPDRYYMECVKEGKITVKPEVASTEGRTVFFADGSKDEVDTVIFCTGYRMDLSFLPENVQREITFVNPITNKTDIALYKMTLAPGLKDMAFCGLLYNFGPHFCMAEMQARLIAAIFSGKMEIPSDAVLRTGVEKIKAYRSAWSLNKGDLVTKFCDDIGKDLGVAPTMAQCLWNPRKLLFSPAYPCFYRTNPAVDGQEMAEKAQVRFDRFVSNPQIAETL